MSDLSGPPFPWVPVHLAPERWEGQPVIWRNDMSEGPSIHVLAPGFSREPKHCGTIEVAGPLAEILEDYAALRAERDRLAGELAAIYDILRGQVDGDTDVKAPDLIRTILAHLRSAKDDLTEARAEIVELNAEVEEMIDKEGQVHPDFSGVRDEITARIRADTIKECAKVAQQMHLDAMKPMKLPAMLTIKAGQEYESAIAAAIRALGEKEGGE